MISVKTNDRFSLQELLEFFRPHRFFAEAQGNDDSNVVPLRLANIVKKLSEPKNGEVRERSIRYIKDSSYAEVETLAAIYRGDDIIVGGLLNSKDCQTNPPFLVRKSGMHSTAGRFHYEVWAVVESAPTDPTLLLELCASVEALGHNICAVPRLVRIAEIGGQVHTFDTRALLSMYQKVKDLFQETRTVVPVARKANVSNLNSFRNNRANCR